MIFNQAAALQVVDSPGGLSQAPSGMLLRYIVRARQNIIIGLVDICRSMEWFQVRFSNLQFLCFSFFPEPYTKWFVIIFAGRWQVSRKRGIASCEQ
jgi:hypothetical protein